MEHTSFKPHVAGIRDAITYYDKKNIIILYLLFKDKIKLKIFKWLDIKYLVSRLLGIFQICVNKMIKGVDLFILN